MRVSIDDYRAFMQTRDSGKVDQKKFQQGAAISVAKRAQTVVDHPGFQTYLDHLSAARDKAAAEKHSLMQRIEQGRFKEDELTSILREIQTLRGAIDAFTVSIELIPNLIKSGADAQSDTTSNS